MHHSRRLRHLLAPALLLFVALAGSSAAEAQIARVQGPSKAAQSPARAAAVKKARSQGVAPKKVNAIGARLSARATEGGDATLGDAKFRAGLSVAPLQARLEVFKQVAAQRGSSVQVFQRRLRGMIKNGKVNRVAHYSKTFFEVTPETFSLFPKVMGENVIWFAASASPGHLHTMLADQDGGPNFTHNTYGQGPLDAATIPREQYIAPAQLTGQEMDRFVRYLNAAVESGDKRTVYGFKTGSGQLVCDTRCTNWATSAPVGELKRWIKTLDKRVVTAARNGELPEKYADGLHAAMAKAATPEERQAMVAEVSAIASLGKRNRSMVKRLGKEFDLVTKTWPNRPKDLVGRESLAETMGVARSQDPAKFMYDLMMSKKVPIVGVMTSERHPDFASKEFDMEIMGTISRTGDVIRGNGWNTQGLGVVPDDRRPGARQPAAAPAAAPAAGAQP